MRDDLPQYKRGQALRARRYLTGELYHRATHLGPGQPMRTAGDMLEASEPVPRLRVRWEDGHVEDVYYDRVLEES